MAEIRSGRRADGIRTSVGGVRVTADGKRIQRAKKDVTLAPVRPNVGIRAAYNARLDKMIATMARSVLAHITRTYRANPPEMASDESPAAALRAMMARMRQEWDASFSELAASAGKSFPEASAQHADRAFAARLKAAGFTVQFRTTRAVNDVLQASIAENVSLIKSIPSEYLTQVETIVMQGVQNGRDMHVIAEGLQKQLGVTRRRAETIARDQTNKSTAVIVRARQQEVGITEALWLHSRGGRHPRPTHLANDRKKYIVAEGWLDPAINKRIWPGTEINCRCVARAILP
jgi:SPP1 gp7 family putative phage head morphogenesis protein